jgi:subfamily B ATP-binding cassette protein MsbA
MIAHRLSTVRGADRIYVIEAGAVVEQGSHAALVRKGGLYARLARQQSLDGEPAIETVT